MRAKRAIQKLLAAFPISETEIVVICSDPGDPSVENARQYHLASGRSVKSASRDASNPERIVLQIGRKSSSPLAIDTVTLRNFRSSGGQKSRDLVSPRFIRNVQTAMELKVPHFGEKFPYRSTLVGLHVSVACCTGCNGGVHDRNLVVLNHHLGGGWSGIWVRTGKTIEAPYPRWQKVLCAGGVIEELNGSMTVVDKGWMQIRKQNEEPHHAPPPLPIETVDLPVTRTPSLTCKSLDGAWVQFEKIAIESAKFMEARERIRGAVNLPRTEVTFSDKSGGLSRACLYQRMGHGVKQGQQLNQLRGFVHAERPGVYALLSDKDEDIRS